MIVNDVKIDALVRKGTGPVALCACGRSRSIAMGAGYIAFATTCRTWGAGGRLLDLASAFAGCTGIASCAVAFRAGNLSFSVTVETERHDDLQTFEVCLSHSSRPLGPS